MDLTLAQPLSGEELVKLTFLESVIDRGQYTFLSVGDALRQIKDQKLWRHTHSSFDLYCQERWEFSQGYAARLLKARDLVGALPPETEILPENEAQARALLRVPEDLRAQIWLEAVRRGGNAFRASRLVKEVFHQYTAEQQAEIEAQARLSMAGHTAGLRKSASNEWYTPLNYLNLVRRFWGGEIDLDPASCKAAQAFVRANRYFTQADNALTIDWEATSVFCNPPYGKVEKNGTNVKHWINKAVTEYNAGRAKEIILLLNAFTSSSWFQPLWDHTICFVYKRIRFISPTNEGAKQPTHSNVFVYMGPHVERFDVMFRTHGAIVQRCQFNEEF